MNDDLLEFARAWKAGYTLPVHPTVGRRLNHALVVAKEDPVPFARATSEDAPSLQELLCEAHRVHDGASEGRIGAAAPSEIHAEARSELVRA